MKKYFLYQYMIMVCLTFINSLGQTQNRYESEIFSSIQIKNDITYGENIDVDGKVQPLLLDLYMPPADDIEQTRPVIIYFHGGGFQNGDKNQKMLTTWLNRFAKRGYVCASVNYRLGVSKSKSDTAYFEALYRGIQDGKAAVRFMKKNAKEYGVDTSQIFVAGQSAGSKIAIHIAYLKENEIPSYINTKKNGILEGTSGNPGYSSKVNGVLNNWGCIVDWKWINKNDVAIYNVHGINDKTVPCDSSFSYHGMKYGSEIIYNRAKQFGIPTGIRLFKNTGHTLDNDSAKQDSAFTDESAWLYKILKKK